MPTLINYNKHKMGFHLRRKTNTKLKGNKKKNEENLELLKNGFSVQSLVSQVRKRGKEERKTKTRYY